jgi:hypothetical protein
VLVRCAVHAAAATTDCSHSSPAHTHWRYHLQQRLLHNNCNNCTQRLIDKVQGMIHCCCCALLSCDKRPAGRWCAAARSFSPLNGLILDVYFLAQVQYCYATCRKQQTSAAQATAAAAAQLGLSTHVPVVASRRYYPAAAGMGLIIHKITLEELHVCLEVTYGICSA